MQILEGCPHKEKAVQQNANAGSLTGLVGSEDHSYLGVGADTGEGGGKKGRLGQKSRQMPDSIGLYVLGILCNDFL